MKVYIIMENSCDGNSIIDATFDKDLADNNVEIRNKFKGIWNTDMNYTVVEKEVVDKPLIDIDKNMLAIQLNGYIMLDGSRRSPKIIPLVAEDWCNASFTNLQSFMNATIFIKAQESDFDLTGEELLDKYGYIWDDILNMYQNLKSENKSILQIITALEDKYKIKWDLTK